MGQSPSGAPSAATALALLGDPPVPCHVWDAAADRRGGDTTRTKPVLRECRQTRRHRGAPQVPGERASPQRARSLLLRVPARSPAPAPACAAQTLFSQLIRPISGTSPTDYTSFDVLQQRAREETPEQVFLPGENSPSPCPRAARGLGTWRGAGGCPKAPEGRGFWQPGRSGRVPSAAVSRPR